jgi:hypothetical protein
MFEMFGDITPVLLIAMVAGIVEFLKKFGIEGNGSLIASFVVALVLGVLFQLGDTFPGISVYLPIAVYAILFALTASGLYDLSKRLAGI